MKLFQIIMIIYSPFLIVKRGTNFIFGLQVYFLCSMFSHSNDKIFSFFKNHNKIASFMQYFTLPPSTCIMKKKIIGLGRFRILGGPRFRILGGPGGPNSQQAQDVVTSSMRRNDVASTSFRRRVPTRFLKNQCQMITFLILKYDIIENSRIELRGIVVPVQVGGLLGGPKGMLAPPSQIIGGGGLAPPWPPLFLRL